MKFQNSKLQFTTGFQVILEFPNTKKLTKSKRIIGFRTDRF